MMKRTLKNEKKRFQNKKNRKNQTLSKRNLRLAVFWNRCTPNVQKTLEKR